MKYLAGTQSTAPHKSTKSGLRHCQSAKITPARPVLFYNIFYFFRYKIEPSALRVPLRSRLSCFFRSFLFLSGSSFVFFYIASRALVAA